MGLTSLLEVGDIYLGMFDKVQMQYNTQGYFGAFPIIKEPYSSPFGGFVGKEIMQLQ